MRVRVSVSERVSERASGNRTGDGKRRDEEKLEEQE